MINAKCLFRELTDVIGLLVVDVEKVCVSNANHSKWLPMTTTMTATSILVKCTEAISEDNDVIYEYAKYKEMS